MVLPEWQGCVQRPGLELTTTTQTPGVQDTIKWQSAVDDIPNPEIESQTHHKQ